MVMAFRFAISRGLPKIQGVAKVPPGFGRIIDIDFQRDGIVLRGEHGAHVFAGVETEFLQGATLS
jgi:hypothetical protein